jgi:hypothetical protein
MIRFGIIGNNTLLMKLVSKHLIYNHKFVNYTNSNLCEYGLYVSPYVNTNDKFKRLQELNFKFIRIDDSIDIPYDYKIDSTNNLHKILKDLDKIVDIHILNQLI